MPRRSSQPVKHGGSRKQRFAVRAEPEEVLKAIKRICEKKCDQLEKREEILFRTTDFKQEFNVKDNEFIHTDDLHKVLKTLAALGLMAITRFGRENLYTPTSQQHIFLKEAKLPTD